MTEPRASTETDPATLRLRRRARRAFVAGYIHELSERHNVADDGDRTESARAAETLRDAGAEAAGA